MRKSPALSALILLPVASGCLRPVPSTPEQRDRGLVMLLTGVESVAAVHTGCVKGLREAGINCAITVEEWGVKPFGTFPNLRSYDLNRSRAVSLAGKLVNYRAEHPDAPITIIGYSGGGGMALFTAEALPEGFELDRIILTSPAVSPDYDPGKALSHCRRGMINFYSPHDWFMAGWATKIWGTMDRVKTDTAGRIGFRDASGRLREQEGLVQIPWQPGWFKLGHWGGHSGWRARLWAREILAQYLR